MVSRCAAAKALLFLLLVAARAPAQEPVSGLRVREGVGHTYAGSRQSGEARLDSLAREVVREDAWLYADGLWVDIGYDERATSVLCSLAAIRAAADLAHGADLIWYHVHPRRSAPVGVHPPSVEDIAALCVLKDFCQREFGARLFGKVFDGFGVWEVDLSEELQSRLSRPPGPGVAADEERFDPRDTASLLVSPARRREVAALKLYLEHERIAQSILRDEAAGREEMIRRYIAGMAEIGVLLRFTRTTGTAGEEREPEHPIPSSFP
ncbi:MAG: hypothetical protein JW820_18845 [Spirochaetales bacterium]|nr:hypothetical protein [Spirochaetales bacterium]